MKNTTVLSSTISKGARSSRRRLACMSASVVAIALCAPAAALAQDDGVGLQEVIVTAQKREQRLQDVPASVTAISSESMEVNRIANVGDLDSLVPNLTVHMQFGGASLPLFTMRGVLAGSSIPGSDRSIGMYIDGVFIGATTGSSFDIADLERVEVLRGPQGTLFGRNSTGGAISLITREPSDQFSLNQTFSYGNYDQFKSQTRLNTGAFGPFSASLNYTHNERRGEIRNLAAGARWDFSPANGGVPTFLDSPKWLGSYNIDSIGAALKYEPNDRFKAIYRFDYTDTHNTPEGNGLVYVHPLVAGMMAAQPNQALMTPITRKRPKAVNNGNTVASWQKIQGHSLTLTYDLNDELTIKNITAYRTSKFASPWVNIEGVGLLTNTGGAAFALLGALNAPTVGAPFLLQGTSTEGKDEQFSTELQVNYDSDFMTLTTGALFFSNKQTRYPEGAESGVGRVRSGAFRVFPNFAVPFTGQPSTYRGRSTLITTESYAFYGQGEFHVTDQLDVVAGARYTKDKRTGFDASIFSAASPPVLGVNVFDVDYSGDKITYSLGANYKITPSNMVYAKYSTGFLSGGSLSGLDFKPEEAKSWEAGIKADWLDNTLRTNLAVFSAKYTNLQSGVSGNTLSPPRPLIANAQTNVGDAKAKGFELEAQYAPLRGLLFTGGIGYTDFKYTELSPLLLAGQDEYLAGLRPDWTANVSAQYETEPLFDDVTFMARMDANYRSKFYLVAGIPRPVSAGGAFPSPLTPAMQAAYKEAGTVKGYWLVNARLSLQGFQVGGADASIALWAQNLFDEDTVVTEQSVVTAIAAQYERARTVGVDLNIAF
jgi:iron complex outermembrane receptor protein